MAIPGAVAASDAPGAARILYFEPLSTLTTDANARTHDKSSPHDIRSLRFDAYGRRFELSLNENSKLTRGLSEKSRTTSLRLYRGHLDGVRGSWARLAVQPDSVHGMIWDGRELYVIEPAQLVRDALVTAADKTTGTVIFRLADVLMDASAASCASGDAAAARKGSDAYGAMLHELKSIRGTMQAAGATVRIELSALGDVPFLQRYGSEQSARDAILLRLNDVDGIFSGQLGVEIQVPSVNVSDASNDPLSSTTAPSALLEELAEVRRRSLELHSRGLTHLFTGRDLDGTTVGIAYIDALCHQQFGAALTEATTRGSWIESLIAAHEIGHNFGAVHDGDPNEACASTPEGLHLMSPAVNGNSTFSQCSLDTIRPNIAAASCIAALPPADIAIAADLGTVHQPVTRPFQWDLTLTNAGGSSAVDVRTEILVPPVVLIDDAYVTGGTCTSGAGVIQCQLGDVPGGATRIVHLTLRSDVIGSSSISARAQAQNETLTANNNGDGTLVIEPEADLAVVLSGPSSVAAGEVFELSFSATNAAAIEATGIRIDVEVPGGATATGMSIADGSCVLQAGNVACSVPSVAAGASVAGVVSLRAATAEMTLRARVSGNYVDPNPANDSAMLVIAATPAPQPAQSNSSGGGGGGSSDWRFLLALAIVLGAQYRAGSARRR